MAALYGIARVSGVSLVAATVKTLLQLVVPSNRKVRVREVGISFRGVVNTDSPVLVDALYQTTAGTSSALTLVKEDDSAAETLQTTALQTFTVEPTAGNIVRSFEVHPQTGLILTFAPGDEIILGGGKRFGLRANAPQAQTVTAYLKYEE